MKKKNWLLAIFCLPVFLFLFSCEKDEEVFGCVFGKIKGVNAEFRIGCMNKAQFYRYLESPSFLINGTPVNRDVRFVRVDDCLQCN